MRNPLESGVSAAAQLSVVLHEVGAFGQHSGTRVTCDWDPQSLPGGQATHRRCLVAPRRTVVSHGCCAKWDGAG